MAAKASTSFFSILSSPSSSSSLFFHRTPFLCPASLSATSLPKFKERIPGLGHVLVTVNCVSERSKQAAEPEPEIAPSPSSESPSSSSVAGADNDADISAYKWIVALGGIGLLETAYLTYLKLTGSDAFCPTGGGSCTTILTSDYSSVFGVPLPLFGMLAYGLVASLGLQLGTEKRTFDTGKSNGEIILVGITTSMAVASAYFLYILSTEFSGESCLYCLASATLSFSLFFITLKRFGLQEIQKILGLQLFVASLVVIALTASYNTAQPGSLSMMETEIPYFETEITKESSPLAIALAKHLHSVGAKLYGAFWCSHCLDQKEIFGREAAKILDYVECFPDGVNKGTKMAQACVDVKLEGFPTWIIDGQVNSQSKMPFTLNQRINFFKKLCPVSYSLNLV
ncbi:thiol-disulfide oxidoreductase LTO1-like isoform X1 [Salvia miltiorrhiza]|uniref:thiol-disulfide oxidoreductase LTO1-like isoform X1 n=1 Tax=Salvia miltiorrhiza TaxID=226208 RepID=UPI0025AB9B3A|nr:thiol-disulfide oxidoreductase LTO1-like isoform X1 [Salvia miltiorrhiza]